MNLKFVVADVRPLHGGGTKVQLTAVPLDGANEKISTNPAQTKIVLTITDPNEVVKYVKGNMVKVNIQP